MNDPHILRPRIGSAVATIRTIPRPRRQRPSNNSTSSATRLKPHNKMSVNPVLILLLLKVSFADRTQYDGTLDTTTPSRVLPTYTSSSEVPLDVSTNTPPAVLTTPEPPQGCPPCDRRRCPRSVNECSLNVGMVRDPCECCSDGICGLRDGAPCFSQNLAGDLPVTARALGLCGNGMECVLRSDLSPTDNPEALCSCIETGPVCGTDNRTHTSSCELHQESDDLWIKYRGPCRAAAWISSAPEPEVVVYLGARIGISCESRGYPTPRMHWDRTDVTNPYDPDITRLPGDDSSVSVQLRGGPEPYMASTWLQISGTTWKHNGSYACVAVNNEGEARASMRIIVKSISGDPDAG